MHARYASVISARLPARTMLVLKTRAVRSSVARCCARRARRMIAGQSTAAFRISGAIRNQDTASQGPRLQHRCQGRSSLQGTAEFFVMPHRLQPEVQPARREQRSGSEEGKPCTRVCRVHPRARGVAGVLPRETAVDCTVDDVHDEAAVRATP